MALPALCFSLSGARRSRPPHLRGSCQLGTAHPAPNPHPPPGAHSAPPQGRGRTDTPLNSPGEGLLHLGFKRRQTAGEPIPGPPPPRDSEPLRLLRKGHQQEDHLPCLVTPVRQPSPWAPGSRLGVMLPPSSGSQGLSVLHPLLKDPPRSLSSWPLPDLPLPGEAFRVLQVEVSQQNWKEALYHQGPPLESWLGPVMGTALQKEGKGSGSWTPG